MNAVPPSADAIKQALILLQQNKPPQIAQALLDGVKAGHPAYAQAQHLRAVCAFRQGQAQQAKDLLVDAIRRGEQTPSAWLNLAGAAAASGMPDDALSVLLDSLQRIPAPKFVPFLLQLLSALGFANRERRPAKDTVFEKLLLPLLASQLKRRDMDSALAMEGLMYEYYVKSTETEAHFKHCMTRMSALFAEAGRAIRKDLPPLPLPPAQAPYRIGFLVMRASMLAHIEVLLSTIKGYRRLAQQPLEIIVYIHDGKDAALDAALRELDVRTVSLPDLYPKASLWQRALHLRERLSADGVHGLVFVSVAQMMGLITALRVAPVQIWWAMKYHSLELDELDGYFTGGTITRYRALDGRQWRNGRLGADDWYDASLESEARTLRAGFGGKLVLASIGRSEKLSDPTFLATVVRILRANPDCVFLWPGRERDSNIQAAFVAGGVADRTYFIGWVNTKLYAQVVDIFLDSFPFPAGFTLFQAMAAGKPAVIYESREAKETGLYPFIGPILAGREGTLEEQQALRELMYDGGEAPGIGIATSPDDYVTLVQALIDDPEWRGRCGRVSKNLIETYLSDPAAMGATAFQHMAEMLATHYPELATVELTS